MRPSGEADHSGDLYDKRKTLILIEYISNVVSVFTPVKVRKIRLFYTCNFSLSCQFSIKNVALTKKPTPSSFAVTHRGFGYRPEHTISILFTLSVLLQLLSDALAET